MTEVIPVQRGRIAGEEAADLRRVGISPNFWYPVAVSASVRRGKTFAARFAGERIALYRSAGFVEVGLRKRYYRATGADAYTMRRERRRPARRQAP